MKKIEVVAAAIISNGKVFAAQRGYGNYEGYWEFPGGKIESGETFVQALQREIFEELNISVEVWNLAGKVVYDYPEFRLTMHCYFCTIQKGNLQILEHKSCR